MREQRENNNFLEDAGSSNGAQGHLTDCTETQLEHAKKVPVLPHIFPSSL
jgi:hypothetical protein